MMSLGSRSGVHWIRESLALTAWASVDEASVLASPGTDSTSRCPSASSATSIAVRSRSCPTTRESKASVTAREDLAGAGELRVGQLLGRGHRPIVQGYCVEGGQVFATRVSTSYVAAGWPSALVTTASQRTSP